MKKIYAYILLTTFISLSTTCMEKERQKTGILNIQTQPSIALRSNSPLLEFNTLNNLLKPQPFQRPVIQRKYTDLDFVPVYVQTNTNESSDTNEIELTPIYRPITGSTTEYLDCITNTKKAIPLIPLSPEHNYLTERLYTSAHDFVNFITSKHNNMTRDDVVLTQNKKYITLIELMIATKKKGITEDFMGKLAYEKDNDHRISFTFNCLKKYLLTIHDLGEKLPFSARNFYATNDSIQTLTTTCKEHITTQEQIENLIKNCPTYDVLWKSINSMIDNGLKWAIPFLYTSTLILSKEYPQYSHITNKQQCLDLLESTLHPNKLDTEGIYNSLYLIEQIKKITKITQAKDLGYIFLNLEKQQTFKEKILRQHPTTTYCKHNFIALFCALTDEYHKNRDNKITPKLIQYYIYNALDYIVVPDSFDTNLLDINQYALKELKELIINTLTHNKKSPENIQNLVDQHYIFNEQ